MDRDEWLEFIVLVIFFSYVQMTTIIKMYSGELFSRLIKPRFARHDGLYLFVWSLLGVMANVSIFLYLKADDSGSRQFMDVTMAMFVVQLSFTIFWGLVTIRWAAIGLAFWACVVSFGASVTVLAFYGVQEVWLSFGLFAPYVVWTLFIVFKTGAIWITNKRGGKSSFSSSATQGTQHRPLITLSRPGDGQANTQASSAKKDLKL